MARVSRKEVEAAAERKGLGLAITTYGRLVRYTFAIPDAAYTWSRLGSKPALDFVEQFQPTATEAKK